MQVNHGATEMGQGVHTNLAMIAARELGIGPEPVDRLIGPDEHLLCRVRRLLRVREHPPAQRVNVGVSRPDQLVQRTWFTALACLDERRVDVHPRTTTSRPH